MSKRAPHRNPDPPGPSPLATPLWLGRFKRNVLGALEKLANGWGDVVRMHFFGQTIIVLRGSEAAHQVLVSKQDNYLKSRQFDLFRPILGDGLVTSSGETWRRSRRMVQPLFAKRYLETYAEHMAGAVDSALERWDRDWREGEAIDLNAEILHVGLDSVGRALFTRDFDSDGKVFGGAVRGALHEVGEMSRNPVVVVGQDADRPGIIALAKTAAPLRWRQYMRHAEVGNAVIEDLVDERIRRGRQDRNDLLQLLMEAEDEDTGEKLERQQVIDEVATFMGAGHETTAQGLTWMFLLLSEHPDALARLLAEVDQVLCGAAPTAETVNRLEWLNACIHEAMRLYPPAWIIPRVAMEDDVIDGFHIPKGSRVLVCVWTTHRDPRVYVDPTEFRPERWLDKATSERPRFSYLPFGGGRRACVGQGFAMLNAALLGAMIAQRYTFTRDRTRTIAVEATITLRPHADVPMFAQRRTVQVD